MSVIKKNSFMSLSGIAPQGNSFRKPSERRSVPNGEAKTSDINPELSAKIRQAEKDLRELIDKREEILSEYDFLRRLSIKDGEKFVEDAKKKSENMLRDAEVKVRDMQSDAENEAQGIFEESRIEGKKVGYDEGYKDGNKRGEEDGYNQGLRRCKETQKELMSLLESAVVGKEKIFQDYENQLFDTIFTICQKITLGSLKQKDKSVIAKMLKSAAKEFRNSAFINVKLSQLDMTEKGLAELESLDIFLETQTVEYELVKDAPNGTLTVDDGEEILDTGIGTQLKMIESIGKGKFRNADDESKANDKLKEITEVYSAEDDAEE